MAGQPLNAEIVGIPHIPSIVRVNVRSGPGTNQLLTGEIAVGTRDLRVLDVAEDAERNGLNGKIYQWFRLMLPNGQTGWVRDDLINIVGDGRRFGYMTIQRPTLAFNLVRRMQESPIAPVGVRKPQPDVSPVGQRDIQPESEPAVIDEPQPQERQQERVPDPQQPEPRPVDEVSSPPTATCMARGGVNVRSGPGTNHNPPLGRLAFMEQAEILDVADSSDSIPLFRWLQIRFRGRMGWVREDFTRLSGDFASLGLDYDDKYPSPAPQSNWVRGFDPDGRYIARHAGWDHAGHTGAPILAGPLGGVVVESRACANCGAAGLSVQDAGLTVGSARVFTPGWNFGYGHFVVVRYDHDLLPESTRRRLSEMGQAGAHLFVMYAHLHQRLVETGDTVMPNQLIGEMGNSGNSTAPHLHLEVRYGANADETRWARLRSGLVTPGLLFLR